MQRRAGHNIFPEWRSRESPGVQRQGVHVSFNTIRRPRFFRFGAVYNSTLSGKTGPGVMPL